MSEEDTVVARAQRGVRDGARCAVVVPSQVADGPGLEARDEEKEDDGDDRQVHCLPALNKKLPSRRLKFLLLIWLLLFFENDKKGGGVSDVQNQTIVSSWSTFSFSVEAVRLVRTKQERIERDLRPRLSMLEKPRVDGN